MIGKSPVWPIFKAIKPGLNIWNIDSWSEFNFGKKRRIIGITLPKVFLAVAVLGKLELIIM